MLKDKDIREPLFDFLEETYGKSRIIEEKQIGKSRADIMMVTPAFLFGIEIKSDADTYVRLERQVKDYNRFFDFNIVVAGKSHAGHIGEHVPPWWGIIVVEENAADPGNPHFEIVREGLPNPKREKKVKLRNQVNFLWRMELAKLQEINQMAKYKEKSKKFVVEKLMEKVDPETLKIQICQALFERDYTTVNEQIKAYKAEKLAKKQKNQNETKSK